MPNINLTDEAILGLLKTDGRKAIAILFEQHYPVLCRIALRIVGEKNTAEDIAQEVFCNLWKKRDTLQIKSAPGAYLKMSVRNRAINHIKSKRLKFSADGEEMQIASSDTSAQQSLEVADLQSHINAAIDNLPEKARIPFCLNRFEEMTYSEIAVKLDVSVKTVEYQVSKALSHLRDALGSYL